MKLHITLVNLFVSFRQVMCEYVLLIIATKPIISCTYIVLCKCDIRSQWRVISLQKPIHWADKIKQIHNQNTTNTFVYCFYCYDQCFNIWKSIFKTYHPTTNSKVYLISQNGHMLTFVLHFFSRLLCVSFLFPIFSISTRIIQKWDLFVENEKNRVKIKIKRILSAMSFHFLHMAVIFHIFCFVWTKWIPWTSLF